MAWRGFDKSGLIAQAEAFAYSKRRELTSALQEVIVAAEERMKEIILDKDTPTGWERVATGRGLFDGRYETGEMFSQVESKVTADDDEAVGEWGWFDPEAYFLLQEEGTDRIAAMDSLNATLQKVIDEMAGHLDRVAGEKIA
ncbi:hypothetical protein [Agromyces larvae]|uniref:HK97 gp10 family phage protein n=1 Tax=Agromyces larvae TaxID=2929802 RepID=A0ABY4C335_9MICO|nr:hypothetical protein [Agromyces larvae]UOE45882.1 hypothetical protein MTO99_09125 [Agromyces larvae]